MEKPAYKIALLGAGNVAWHLAPALEKAGHEIVYVYSRTLANAEALAQNLKAAQATDQPDFSQTSADLYIMAVKDSALPELLQAAVFPENSLVAHTSGTLPLMVFEPYKNIRGAVFYPLQTFSKNTPVSFRNIPFCLETTDENAMLLLQKTAGSLSEQVYKVNSEERKILHLAAVFACNFTNHLFGISAEILQQNHLRFEMLQPLVEQTVQKAFSQNPFSVQTGPAIRHDENTIQTQLQFLQTNPTYQQIYELLTRSIQQKS
ncbi:DUF2520 domain-containing protein [Adhaeribacter sp. BT258]|uniref:DUF2520 domain-containing protein n=1 Tax=Adhaeribacter terrigena TaxID=2793070 RepID=A0ABS1C7E7_9BACT|nr:Rossmann-like and DUF2520 domain-containing protein [Adhaeribacter terrigena]MBK0404510.1 DUF2520 domain-containing protein [Adhaeribacter terrigena]